MLRSVLLATIILGASYTPVFAQEFTAVSTIERMISTENADGTVTVEFIKADRVTPGENLYYQLAYNNASPENIEDASLVMNVPQEVIYSEHSADIEGKDVQVAFSTDGGQTYAPRGELKVTVGGQPRAAGSEDITNIRWTFNEPIAPGSEGLVGFTAVVR